MGRVNKKVLLVELLLLAAVLFMAYKLQLRSLYFAMQLGEILILTAILKVMPLLELSVNDLVATAFFMVFNSVILHFTFFLERGIVPFFLLLSLELLTLIGGIHHRKKGYGIPIGYATVCCMGVLYVCRKWEQLILSLYYEREGEFGFVIKALYLLICMAFLFIAVFISVHCLNAFMKKWLEKLQTYSMIYKEIDRSIMLVMILTLGTLSMKGLMWKLWHFLPKEGSLLGSSYDPPHLWLVLCIVVIITQIIYIRLLVKSISVKEEMHLQKKNLAQLAAYNHELEQNMEDMRAIRHDIKNMFLTMGGFVDRSNDEEMKLFYEENIVPFAKRELQKNDLYIKLAYIHNEGLKSFLYFKMMQGIEQDVPVEIQIPFMVTEDIFCIGQADLIRILGILIDNGMEEAKVCHGTVTVSIVEKEQGYIFSVSNTVRRQVRERGIAAGTTDKGPGRGNGLLIVNKLLKKYKNVLLNSFFREDEFVQCLRIKI